MTDYPFLSLSRVTVDPELARQLPRRLAYYYLAIPLARDEDQLTVVMAYPENQAAVVMLQAVLSTPIVPVQGSPHEIKATLNQLWSEHNEIGTSQVLCWGLSEERAQQIAHVFGAQVLCLDTGSGDLETVLTVAREGRYSLTVLDALPAESLSHFLRASSTPVLLMRGAALTLRHILLVLRGHSPDDNVLDWVIPLAETGAQITLFTVAPTAARPKRGSRLPSGLAALLADDSAPGEHIATCARRLTEAGIQGVLKLRQGIPEEQIAAEVAQEDYDLITIAAEAHGDFVQRVLNAMTPNNRQPVLVIKPITD